jgi:NitT/TauT family transport system substrate-binding protein
MVPIAVALTLISVFPLAAQSAAATSARPILKVGILPDADSFPFLVAESGNLFQVEGVDVSLVRFQNPVERDAAFQAGVVDGIVGDLLAAALAVQGGFAVKITSLTDGRYGIVASPGSGISALADLAGKPVGISSNTIIHYMVDSFLRSAGLPASKIAVLPVPKMPLRLEMVVTGQLAAAGLPEPLLTQAQLRGARLIASTDDRGLGAGVLMFGSSSVASKTAAIRAMYKAYWKACQAINAEPDAWRPLLKTQAGFSPEAAAAWRFVRYKKPRMPSLEDMELVFAWMKERGLLRIDIAPESLLDGGPISGW